MDCKFETGTVVVRGRTYLYEASAYDGGWDVRFYRETSHGTVEIAFYEDQPNVELAVDHFREDEGSYLDDIASGFDRS